MDHEQKTRFQVLCEQLQQAGIAKVSFQTYWFSDEEQIDEVYYFDENEQPVDPPSSSLPELVRNELWDYLEQEQQYDERFGRFELYPAYQRLARLGATYLNLVGEDYMDVMRPYFTMPEEAAHVWVSDYFYGGPDSEAAERCYRLLQQAGLRELIVQYYQYEGPQLNVLACIDQQGQRAALPAGLSECDLHEAFYKIERKGTEYGHFRFLVNERCSFWLRIVRPQDVGLGDVFAQGGLDFFDGGFFSNEDEHDEDEHAEQILRAFLHSGFHESVPGEREEAE